MNTSRVPESVPDRMNGISIVRRYIDRMLNQSKAPVGAMKVLILDTATTQIVSAVYSQTEILSQQVYLVRNIQQQAPSSLPNAHAICFLRPTSLPLLAQELSSNASSYASYSLYISGPLTNTNTTLKTLATADATHQRLHQVLDYGPDGVPVRDTLWHCPASPMSSLAFTVAAGTAAAPAHAAAYERNVAACLSLVASLGCNGPIRYAGPSPAAEELAREVAESMDQEPDVFGTAHTARRPHQQRWCVLVVDRRQDPVTPLLSQWTYQAMVHELLGLNNHRVVLKKGNNNSPQEEVVLSTASDKFFAQHLDANFGDLGQGVQKLVRDYQQQQNAITPQNMQSIEELQSFMDSKFPELRSQQHMVNKHVSILDELSHLVDTCHLLDVSALEQGLACHDDHSAHWRELLEKLQSSRIQVADKLRLGLLYALRYEHVANVHMLQQAMRQGGVPADKVQLLPVLLRYAQPRATHASDSNLMRRMTQNIVSSVGGGVENVYTQHEPVLISTLQNLVKGKLGTREYPIVRRNHQATGDTGDADAVLVYMVGGVTYEEGAAVAEWNRTNATKVVLAGSTVHNSTSFLEELQRDVAGLV